MAAVICARLSGQLRRQVSLRVGVAGWLTTAAAATVLTGCGPVDDAPRVAWSPPSPSLSATPGPSPSPSPAASVSPSVPASPSPTPSRVFRYVFPIVGKTSYAHTHHDYPASDMMAACGLPVRAVTSGVILEARRVDQFDKANPRGEDKGGMFVSLLGDDGVRYYGSHLSAVQTGIQAGVRVAAGDRIGLVGTTGNSGACHLHFGISPPCLRTGDWWTRRGAVYPWPYLDSWRAGGTKSPVSEVTAWQRAKGCPTAPTSG
ncbi:MAG: M23 family metallopeptidase [Dactylosporangium sp.]|nr:M23 family metallopeptidase [Dactylosporangium sp.]NNJ61659.1 M23 family metallopeptidase [Dactylosporangium sp.]